MLSTNRVLKKPISFRSVIWAVQMGGLLLVQLLRLTIFYAEPEIRDVYCPLVDTLMRRWSQYWPA